MKYVVPMETVAPADMSVSTLRGMVDLDAVAARAVLTWRGDPAARAEEVWQEAHDELCGFYRAHAPKGMTHQELCEAVSVIVSAALLLAESQGFPPIPESLTDGLRDRFWGEEGRVLTAKVRTDREVLVAQGDTGCLQDLARIMTNFNDAIPIAQKTARKFQ